MKMHREVSERERTLRRAGVERLTRRAPVRRVRANRSAATCWPAACYRHCCWPAASAAGLGTTQIAGALIAQGSIVVDSNVKKVQHPTGGVVGKLNVQDGDRVKAGDILVQLDDTVTRANLAIVTKGLDELTARKARLESRT